MEFRLLKRDHDEEPVACRLKEGVVFEERIEDARIQLLEVQGRLRRIGRHR